MVATRSQTSLICSSAVGPRQPAAAQICVGPHAGREARMETVGRCGVQQEAMRASAFSTWAGTAAQDSQGLRLKSGLPTGQAGVTHRTLGEGRGFQRYVKNSERTVSWHVEVRLRTFT